MTETTTDGLSLKTAELRRELEGLSGLADGFGQRMAGAFARAAIDGGRLSDVLRQLALSLARMALNQGLQPLAGLIDGAVGAALPQAQGQVAAPLAQAQAARPAGVSVSVQIATPDAASFARSEAQVSAMIARAVARGQRNM